MKKHLTLFLTVVFMLTANAQSQLELPNVFGDNMVLQQNSNTRLWGKANPGTKITISTDWNEIVILVPGLALPHNRVLEFC